MDDMKTPHIKACDNSFHKIVGPSLNITLALEESFPFAHEAGVYIPHLDVIFVTSNQFTPEGQQEKVIVISKLSRGADGSWTREEITAPAVPYGNGGVNYKDGILFCAQGSHTESGGLVWMSPEAPYDTKVIADNYQGLPFNSVNDVVVHSDGSIWFTDPSYGAEQGIRPAQQLANQVYRFDPKTGGVRVVADGFGKPNGICFAPDEQTVYITDTDYIRGDGTTDPRRARTM